MAVGEDKKDEVTGGQGDFEGRVDEAVSGTGTGLTPGVDKADEDGETLKGQDVADATRGIDRQIRSVQDWLDAEENRPETEEERKVRERRERSKRIVGAVSDGLSALSNLFFTHQYAPNMYEYERHSLGAALERQREKLKGERERKKAEHLNFALKLGQLENDRARTVRELEGERERMKLAREEAERKAEAHNWLALLQPDKQREQAGKAEKAQQEAKTSKAEADNAVALQAAKLDTEKARAGSQRASAANSLAAAGAHRASAANSLASAGEHRARTKKINSGNSGSGGGKYTAYDAQGNAYSFNTVNEADNFAKRHGTWVEEKTIKTKTHKEETSTKSGGYRDRPEKKSGSGKGSAKSKFSIHK